MPTSSGEESGEHFAGQDPKQNGRRPQPRERLTHPLRGCGTVRQRRNAHSLSRPGGNLFLADSHSEPVIGQIDNHSHWGGSFLLRCSAVRHMQSYAVSNVWWTPPLAWRSASTFVDANRLFRIAFRLKGRVVVASDAAYHSGPQIGT